ncbi:rhamnose ABC transporter substrate-binding protein [Lachnoclostridium phytofermentans]|uniref:Putative sugar ABC transporter, substrate-binding protein n=1 Tax=Lachnoclostridium phytofermentans (strain ATCC 700394 / DSM 18823 / ISDg) TaxID=357809 RepID=A9KIX1_LACP7|nr:rhamnose ABC transporter substrate-binding protein [Lachnoclostridium phytofermentans]ABX40970.1 putative sugar ABC transporter, substrate-binding protein [Lachnoclostridium phytofermentans ISDg]
MKKIFGLVLCLTMTASLLAGCSSKTDNTSSNKAKTPTTAATTGGDGYATTATYAIIVKSAGNPYNQKESEGYKQVIEANGGKCVIQEPKSATAEDQITCINNAISQGVDCIAIAANDTDALEPALTEAKNQGIHVLSLDSATNANSRKVFVNQAGTTQIAQALMDAILDISGGSGDWAVLSAASTATNQNAWIDGMKTVMQDSKYSKLNLIGVYYGDDEYQASCDQTEAILAADPNIKVICAPTTVGIMAAAKVLQDKGLSGKVKLTGLGLPSEMADYIGDDDQHSCPYMFLWNPIQLGNLAAYASISLVNGTITGAADQSFTVPDKTLGDNGSYKITAAADGGTEIILGAPFKFEPSNIAEWAKVY